ncbi:hypothetical protein MRBBS_1354 [Marinobacter sp. BSs20148]|jgi:hypothetical protein|nr:hypothetical protein MRBBS_1354 [Marinobacter sp. BSs20148]
MPKPMIQIPLNPKLEKRGRRSSVIPSKNGGITFGFGTIAVGHLK